MMAAGREWSVGNFYNVTAMAKTTVQDSTLKSGRTSLIDRADRQGKSLKTTRIVTRNGTVIHKDVWTSYWPMYPQQISGGNGDDKHYGPADYGHDDHGPPTTDPPST